MKTMKTNPTTKFCPERGPIIQLPLFFFFFFFCFSGPHLWHMEVPRLGGESELQLSACTMATVTQDATSCICEIYRSSRQHRILNPPSKARD